MGTARELAPLRSISNALHLLYHRNKNQHRQSHWWKWLAILRRAVLKLTRELQTSQQEPSMARIRHLAHIVIPKCYGPFTQLIRDQQFSALGLVLVAELANVKRTMDSLLLENDALIKDQITETERQGPRLDHRSLGSTEDIGETVARTEQLPSAVSFKSADSNLPSSQPGWSSNDPIDAKALEGSALTSIRPRTIRKANDQKRASLNRSRDNPIDRLFSGLM